MCGMATVAMVLELFIDFSCRLTTLLHCPCYSSPLIQLLDNMWGILGVGVNLDDSVPMAGLMGKVSSF